MGLCAAHVCSKMNAKVQSKQLLNFSLWAVCWLILPPLKEDRAWLLSSICMAWPQAKVMEYGLAVQVYVHVGVYVHLTTTVIDGAPAPPPPTPQLCTLWPHGLHAHARMLCVVLALHWTLILLRYPALLNVDSVMTPCFVERWVCHNIMFCWTLILSWHPAFVERWFCHNIMFCWTLILSWHPAFVERWFCCDIFQVSDW